VQNLYNSLTSSIIEYNDKGEQVQRPPTAVMLRAARALKQAMDINNANNITVQQQHILIDELSEQLRKANESLHEARQQASNVGSGGVLDRRDDSNSEAGISPESGSPGTS